MRKAFVACVAGVAVFCALVLSSAPAHAECTTQGALALALADLLKLNVTTTEAAVAALKAIGVEPDSGWRPEECLAPEVIAQVRSALDRATADGGLAAGSDPHALANAMEVLKTTDRNFPAGQLSPFKP